MFRPRSVFLVVAMVASLLACRTPGTRGDPAPLLGPYTVARSTLAPPVRDERAPLPDVRADAYIFREPRHLCELRGNRGSC
jgi:hypothetical protein